MMNPIVRAIGLAAFFSFSFSTLPTAIGDGFASAQIASQPGRGDVRIGNSFENRLERLVLRRLRRDVNRPYGFVVRPAHSSIQLIGGSTQSLSITNNRSDASGLLRQYSAGAGRKPEALVIKVPERLKRLAEERDRRRTLDFAAAEDDRRFGFYRDNEAYDLRFPSVVYLRAPD